MPELGQSRIAGLGTTGGKDDFRGIRPHQGSHLLAGLVDCPAHRLASTIRGRGIIKILTQVRQHSLQHLGGQRSRGVIIPVNHGYFCSEAMMLNTLDGTEACTQRCQPCTPTKPRTKDEETSSSSGGGMR